MKFNEIKANFDKIEFHRPTKNVTGTGVQLKGTVDGKLNVQMAKQLTPHSRESQATYAWTDPDKNTMFILSADELREVIMLIRKTLKGKATLFNQDKHNKFAENPDFDCVKKYHQSGTGGKTIMFLPKEYRDQLQLEMSVSFKKNGQNLLFTFSFTKQEMEKLEMIFYLHQVRELPIPQGFMSCIVDENKEVLKCDYMPNLNAGDFIVLTINGAKKNFRIQTKTFVTQKNIIVYSV